VAASGDPSFRHYKVGDRLRQAELSLPVVYSTHWCGTGFGRKTLDAQELNSAFDLPLWMQPQDEASSTAWLESGVFGRMSPLQLFNAVVDQTLPFLRKEDEFCEAATVTGEVPTPLIADYGVDLPLIGKFLVHSWVYNALITEKAGKSDDADVPTHLWDQRIVQVLNIPIQVLNTMRKWLFKRYCRGVDAVVGSFSESLPWERLGFEALGFAPGVVLDQGWCSCSSQALAGAHFYCSAFDDPRMVEAIA
jgi:hypothetical protein